MRKRRKKLNKTLSTIIFALAVILVALSKGDVLFDNGEVNNQAAVSAKNGDVVVHFIDVGQGSSTLIQSGKKGILIDAGEREYSDTVINYIKSCGINELPYVIASHPHTDHIGALSDVISAIKTENIIMPKLSKVLTPTTKTYERLLKAVQSNSIKAIAAKYGEVYSIDNASITILGPVEQGSDLNNMSVVCKLMAYNTSFMLLADAEKEEMQSILAMNPNLKSDIISMGHHGSRTSIQKTYLNKVAARVAVISCGKDNEYGHPHKEAVSYLTKNNIKYYRTDTQSTVAFICNEKGFKLADAA